MIYVLVGIFFFVLGFGVGATCIDLVNKEECHSFCALSIHDAITRAKFLCCSLKEMGREPAFIEYREKWDGTIKVTIVSKKKTEQTSDNS